jgi:hypothetical protein
MVGLDLHTGFPAIIPVPFEPFAPHLVVAGVRCFIWQGASSKENTDIQMPPGDAMAKIFDIGPLIPHVTLPALDNPVWWVIYSLTSSSQGHFGVASVQTPQGPIAVALFLVANPQLDCASITQNALPLGLPTGIVIAPNTVVAGLTLGDLIAGILSMVLVSAATFAIGAVLSWGLPKLGTGILNGLIRILPPEIMLPATLIGVALAQLSPAATTIVKTAISTVIGWAVGSPMGFSFNFAPLGSLSSPIGSWTTQIGEAIDANAANPLGINDYLSNKVLLPTGPVVPILVPSPI